MIPPLHTEGSNTFYMAVACGLIGGVALSVLMLLVRVCN